MATPKKSGWQYHRSISTKVNVLGRTLKGGVDALGRPTAVSQKKQT